MTQKRFCPATTSDNNLKDQHAKTHIPSNTQMDNYLKCPLQNQNGQLFHNGTPICSSLTLYLETSCAHYKICKSIPCPSEATEKPNGASYFQLFLLLKTQSELKPLLQFSKQYLIIEQIKNFPYTSKLQPKVLSTSVSFPVGRNVIEIILEIECLRVTVTLSIFSCSINNAR